MGGRRRGWAGPGGKRGRTGGGSAGPGAGDPQAREAQAWVGDEGCGDTWVRCRCPGRRHWGQEDPESPLGWSGRELRAGPAILPRARTRHPIFGISETKYVHARRKVMGRRLVHGLFLRDPLAASGASEDSAGKEPSRRRARPRSRSLAAQVRAIRHPLGHSSATSF